MIVYTKDAAIEFSVSELESSPALQQFLQSLSDKTPPKEDSNEQGGGILSSAGKVSLTSAQHYVIPIAIRQGLEGCFNRIIPGDQISSIGGNSNNLINSKKSQKNPEKSKNRVKSIFGYFSGIFQRIFQPNFVLVVPSSDLTAGIPSTNETPPASLSELEAAHEVSVTSPDTIAVSSEEGRRRGRPRKATPSLEMKRPRGRPRKHPVEESIPPAAVSGEVSSAAPESPYSNQDQTEPNQEQTEPVGTPVDHSSDDFSTCVPNGMLYFEEDEAKGVELKRIERLTLGRLDDPFHLTAKQVWEIYKAYRLSLSNNAEFYRRIDQGGNIAELFDDSLLAPIFRLSVSFGEVVRYLFTVIPHEPRKYSMFLKDWYSPLVDIYRLGIDVAAIAEAVRAQIKNPRFRLNCPRGLVTKAAEAMARMVLLGQTEEIVLDRERLLQRVFGEGYKNEQLRA